MQVDRDITTGSGHEFKKPQFPFNGAWQSALVCLYGLGIHLVLAKGFRSIIDEPWESYRLVKLQRSDVKG